MAMKPIKLKGLLTQTKKPDTQQIEIMEDYVLSVKAVFEGVVKDVPEDMLSKYYISDWYVRDETSVFVVLVWTNPHEQFNKHAENSNSDSHRVTIHDLMGNGCCTNPYIDFAIVNIKTWEVLVDRIHDRTHTIDDNKDYDQFLTYELKTVRAWEARDGKMIFYILPQKKEEGKSMKPTVKSFLALAEDKEQTVHIARFKSDSADGYFDEEVFCGNPKEVPECYASKKVTEWTTADNSEIVLYVN